MPSDAKHPFLVPLGERIRGLRRSRSMTRKQLAAAAGVSERHLGNLEMGTGNASVLILQQVAQALGARPAELLDEGAAPSPEWLLIRDLLAHQEEGTLRRAREAIAAIIEAATPQRTASRRRVALIGLRGAGKSTLGRLLAQDLGFAFVELSRDVERLAGCTVSELQALYGQDAYRRYERRAVEEALKAHAAAVIATPGGIVAEPATYDLLLAQCTTVWLQAHPEDHMARVAAQGDLRPMAGNAEAMADLKGILAHREPFHARADLRVDTSAQPLAETLAVLRQQVRRALGLPV